RGARRRGREARRLGAQPAWLREALLRGREPRKSLQAVVAIAARLVADRRSARSREKRRRAAGDPGQTFADHGGILEGPARGRGALRSQRRRKAARLR